jgi:hypothetical protein
MSEQLLSAIADMISRATAEPLPVIVLTDEEVAALDTDLADPGPVPLPWLAGKDEGSRTLACQVALRGLAARHLVVPLGQRNGSESIALRDDLRAVLAMRRSAHAALFALRQSDGQMLLLYLGDSGGLEEAISPSGLHAFTVVSHAAANERLARFCDPGDAASPAEVASQPVVLPLAEIARGAELPCPADARSVTMVTRLVYGSAASERRLTVYTREAGVTVTYPVNADAGPALGFAEVNRSGLRAQLAGLLDVSDPGTP